MMHVPTRRRKVFAAETGRMRPLRRHTFRPCRTRNFSAATPVSAWMPWRIRRQLGWGRGGADVLLGVTERRRFVPSTWPDADAPNRPHDERRRT